MCYTPLKTKAKVVTHALGTLSKASPSLAEESISLATRDWDPQAVDAGGGPGLKLTPQFYPPFYQPWQLPHLS